MRHTHIVGPSRRRLWLAAVLGVLAGLVIAFGVMAYVGLTS